MFADDLVGVLLVGVFVGNLHRGAELDFLALEQEIDPESLGFGITVFANVGLHSQAESDLVAFEALVRSWPEVRECDMLAGETDFLLKIVAVDWDSYQRFLTSRLTAAPNVSVVKSALAIRNTKNLPGVPISAE